MNFPLNEASKKKLNWIAQFLLFIGFFIGLSTFLAKDMLDNQQSVPNLASYPHIEQQTDTQALLLKEWHQSPQHLVYFFAPWCTVCALSQPSLQAFAKLKPDTQIVMVALDWQDPQAVTDFKQKHQFSFPLLLGDQRLKQQWQVDAYPSYYFVDSQGKVTSKDRGIVTLPGLLARSI